MDFQMAAKRLPTSERVAFCFQTIADETNQELIAEAARDLARFAPNIGGAEEALAAVENLIDKIEGNHAVLTRLRLAKARLLARMGEKEASSDICRSAVVERNYPEAYKEFIEIFQENGWNKELAIDEFHRRTADEYSISINEYYDSSSGFSRPVTDFLAMLSHLRAVRRNNAQCSVTEEIYPKLSESVRRPEAREIAKALCLGADERYEESLEVLREVESDLRTKNDPEAVDDESNDLPLYFAAILFLEGRDYDAAREAFAEYMKRNSDDATLVLNRAVYSLAYEMEKSTQDGPKILELTQLLVNSDIIADEKNRVQLPKSLVASLLEMHRQGLLWHNQEEEANIVSLQLMHQYYPDTLSGANAALNLARYLFASGKDIEGSERLLNDILVNAPYDGIAPHARVLLATIRMENGDRAAALRLVEEALDQVGPTPPEGHFLICRQEAQDLHKILTIPELWAARCAARKGTE